MREYKFRGKRIDNSEWVYGSYTHCQDGEGHTSIIPFRANYHVPVDPETVGQYTGLSDRNGKEIYEGDEVRFDDTYTTDNPIQEGIVGFGNASFYIDSGYTKHYRWIDYECEVIGNRWDNPDLLEGEI